MVTASSTIVEVTGDGAEKVKLASEELFFTGEGFRRTVEADVDRDEVGLGWGILVLAKPKSKEGMLLMGSTLLCAAKKVGKGSGFDKGFSRAASVTLALNFPPLLSAKATEAFEENTDEVPGFQDVATAGSTTVLAAITTVVAFDEGCVDNDILADLEAVDLGLGEADTGEKSVLKGGPLRS